jgi:transcriptional antiterminator NusG
VTEQTGTKPDVLPDPPAASAGADQQSGSAPAVAQEHAEPQAAAPQPDRDEAAVVEGGGANADVTLPASTPNHAETGPEAAASANAVVRSKAAEAARPVRSRKAAAPAPLVVSDVPKSELMNWYILKVQSNREESIREGLLRRVSIHGLDRYFGEVIVPTEKVTEFKGGKKRVIKRKLYPGYIVVHMEINEDTWFLVRETPGIGDFTGASGVPSAMLPHEVERIIAKQEEKSEKAPDLKIPFTKGDRVKVIEGNFENFEGEVDAIDKTNGRVTVMITIFNRTTPVEFEYWQVESV